MQPLEPPKTDRARILVVEGDFEARADLVASLIDDGHDAKGASDGAIALERALTHRPDVVLYDYAMPVGSGADLVESVEMLLRPSPILVAMSPAADVTRWCFESGVPFFLAKPFAIATLTTTIRNAIGAAGRASLRLKLRSLSGEQLALRTACVMAVGGAASATNLADVLPRALRHARIAVVDSADEALHLLDSVTPELLVVLEGKAHGELRAIAAMRDIPVLVRAKP